jgi:hypothetical protein
MIMQMTVYDALSGFSYVLATVVIAFAFFIIAAAFLYAFFLAARWTLRKIIADFTAPIVRREHKAKPTVVKEFKKAKAQS